MLVVLENLTNSFWYEISCGTKLSRLMYITKSRIISEFRPFSYYGIWAWHVFMDLCRLKWAAQMFGLGQQYLECESPKRRMNKKPMNMVFFARDRLKFAGLSRMQALLLILRSVGNHGNKLSVHYVSVGILLPQIRSFSEFMIVCSIYKYGSGI